MSAEVILLAGGSGNRMAGSVSDKVLAPLDGKSAFRRCLEAFLEADVCERFVIVYRHEHQRGKLAEEAARAMVEPLFVRGGARRQDSVRAGLAATSPGSDLVFIHDCARALIHPESLRLVAAAAGRTGAAVLAHPVTDTIKRLPTGDTLESARLEDLDRERLWAMETPQVFRRDWIHAAYEQSGGATTDDTAVAVAAGHRVTVVHNPHPNPKLTHPEDLPYLAHLLALRSAPIQEQ